MNVTQNVNQFTDKGVVSAKYIPHTIMAQINWDLKKYLQVECGAYVQAWQVNDPKNTNILRTLDGIYICPALNFRADISLWTCGQENWL